MDREALLKKTVDELKAECRLKGLMVGGNKPDIVNRLLGLEPPKTKEPKAASATPKKVGPEATVNKLLRQAGYDDPQQASKCARLAIFRGHLVFTGKPDELSSKVNTATSGHRFV